MPIIQSRRNFLASLSAAGAAAPGRPVRRSPTSRRRRPRRSGSPRSQASASRRSTSPRSCCAPRASPRRALRQPLPSAIQHGCSRQGELDFSLHFAAPTIIPIDAGDPITVLAGVHIGCFELFAKEHIRGVMDLKGKSVAIQGLGRAPHVS